MCKQYNGWTNRETWALKLHIDNDSGFYSTVNEYVAHIVNTNTLEDFPTAKREIAGWLEEFITELFDFESIFDNRALYSVSQDIGSLYRVNWYEIAESLYEDYAATLDEANA